MNRKQIHKTSRTACLAGAVVLLTACGGGGDGGTGGDPAVGCIDQQPVANGAVDITNTCEDNVIVLTGNGQRFVLGPGAVNRVPNVNSGTNFGACFAPSEPEFTSATEFVCN
jgi:hypothetical protein